MTLRRVSFLFACICVLTLAACGFHPRAELVLPADLGPVRVITGDPYSPLGDSLSRVLTRAGAQPANAVDANVAAKGCGPALPRIDSGAGSAVPNAASGSGRPSVDSAANAPVLPSAADHGTDAIPPCPARVATLSVVSETWSEYPLTVDAFSHVREYVITYTVKFSFVAADGTDISALQEARLQRDFTYDDAHALGASQERDTIHDEMQRDMAATIIRRIGIALRHYKT